MHSQTEQSLMFQRRMFLFFHYNKQKIFKKLISNLVPVGLNFFVGKDTAIVAMQTSKIFL